MNAILTTEGLIAAYKAAKAAIYDNCSFVKMMGPDRHPRDGFTLILPAEWRTQLGTTNLPSYVRFSPIIREDDKPLIIDSKAFDIGSGFELEKPQFEPMRVIGLPMPVLTMQPQGVVMIESCVPDARPRVPFADKRKERRYHRRCVRSLARGFSYVAAADKLRMQAHHRKMARRIR